MVGGCGGHAQECEWGGCWGALAGFGVLCTVSSAYSNVQQVAQAAVGIRTQWLLSFNLLTPFDSLIVHILYISGNSFI